MQQREQRYRVRITARMRTAEGWCEVAIRNVSAHGMMLSAPMRPRPGSYVEIRRDAMTVVARAVWSEDGAFGVRTQDALDLDAFRQGGPARPRVVDGALVERRRTERHGAAAAERARQLGRIGQFAAITALLIAAATLLAGAVHVVFDGPFAAIRHGLLGEAPGS